MASERRGSIAVWNGSEAEGTLNATNSTRGAMRGFVSGRSRYPPKRSGVAEGDVNQGCGTLLGEADCTGLDPEAVYVYGERVEGRARRPPQRASTVARNKAAHWKANPHIASISSQIQCEASCGALPRGARFDRLYKTPEWWNGRRSGLKIRGLVIRRTGSSPVSGTRPKLRKYLAQRRREHRDHHGNIRVRL